MLRLAVRVRREDAELALAELLGSRPAGVEETDLGDRVEYAIYGAPGELPALPDLRAAAGDALVDVSTSEVADDWAQRWRDFHRPIEVGGRLRVRAAVGRAAARRRRARGRHRPRAGVRDRRAPHHAPVPRAAARAGDGRAGARRGVDAGCGSGVLAIAAAQAGLGAGGGLRPRARVVAATRGQRARQRRRGRAPRATTSSTTGRRRGRRWSWPTCCARCCCGSRGTASRGAQPDVLIASGLLAHEADEVAAAFARAPRPARGRPPPRRRVGGVAAPARLTYVGRMRLGILTGGGDCPGLNAVIRAVVRKADAARATRSSASATAGRACWPTTRSS